MKVNLKKITVKSYIENQCHDRRFKKMFVRNKREMLKSIALANSYTRVRSYGDYNLVINRKCKVLELDDGVRDRIIDNIPYTELERFIGKWNNEQKMIVELKALSDQYWKELER